jgi:hypothetical protein
MNQNVLASLGVCVPVIVLQRPLGCWGGEETLVLPGVLYLVCLESL